MAPDVRACVRFWGCCVRCFVGGACPCAGVGGDEFIVHSVGPVVIQGPPHDHGNGVYTVTYTVDAESPQFATAFQVRNVIQIDVALQNPRYVDPHASPFAVVWQHAGLACAARCGASCGVLRSLGAPIGGLHPSHRFLFLRLILPVGARPRRTGYNRQLKGCPFSPSLRMPSSNAAASVDASLGLGAGQRKCRVW
jgi:hypothetical protein